MKKTILLLSAVLLSFHALAQGNFTIKGTIKGAEGKMIYLNRGGRLSNDIDSTKIKNGKFSFKGTLDRPFESGTLAVDDRLSMNQSYWQVALEPTTITFKGDAKVSQFADIRGGEAQDQLNKMISGMRPFLEPLMKMNAELYKADSAKRDSLEKIMQGYSKQYSDFVKSYIDKETDSYYATQFLNMEKGRMSFEELKAAFERLTPRVQKYGVDADEIREELATLDKVRPGKLAPDFTANDINGKPFTLSSLRGKVVIIDFWASWCVPCRRSNPHMLELYKKYHDKGLDMVYVADDDRAEDKWHAAVEKDQLIGDGFHHVLRGLKWDDKTHMPVRDGKDLSSLYAIHYLPTKYLIGKDGKIICRINDESKLEAQIQEALSK